MTYPHQPGSIFFDGAAAYEAHLNEQAVQSWNNEVRVGAPVTYRDDGGQEHLTHTRSEAYVLSGHTPVVFVEGKSGCVALERVSNRDD